MTRRLLFALLAAPFVRFRRKAVALPFTFRVTKGSLQEFNTIHHKLLCLQLSKAGLMDHWTLAKELGIQNFNG